MGLRKSILLPMLVFLTCLFSNPAFSAVKTIVTVIEGRVACFDISEELIPTVKPGELRIGTFIERKNDYSGWVLIGKRRELCYIPHDLRDVINVKIQPGVEVIVQKKERRIYQTWGDIISAAVETVAGSEYIKGETKPVAPRVVSELREIADVLREGIKSEESASVEEAEGDVVKEVIEEVITVAEVAPTVVAGEQREESQGTFAGQESEAEAAAEAADTGQDKPKDEPTYTPPVATPEYYWVDPINGNNNDNGSRDNPWLTITYALANADPTVSTSINLVAGTYGTTGAGYNGETFPLNMRTNLNLVGSGSSSSIIRGDGTNRIINANAVSGVTISGVRLMAGGGSGGNGGAVAVTGGSSITIDQCLIGSSTGLDAANSATGGGGGISVEGGSTLTLTRSEVRYNQCGSTGGGGIYVTGATARIAGCTINNNFVTTGPTTGPGGGIAVTSNGTLVVTAYGDSNLDGDLDDAGDSFSSSNNINSNANSGSPDQGGGVYINGSTATISYTRIQSNGSSGPFSLEGAGVAILSPSSTTTLTNCIIAANGQLGFGSLNGSVYLSNCGSNVTIRNCTIANNVSTSFGGMYLANNSDPTITHTIIFSNSTYGIYEASNNDDPTVTYCDLNGNGAGPATDYYDNDTATGYAGSNIDGLNGGAINNCNIPGGFGGGNANPGFDANYKHAAATTAVDGGDPATSIPARDIAGTSRPQDGDSNGTNLYDLGAYERTAAGDPAITGTIYDSVTGETISSPVVAIYKSGTTTALSTTISNPYTFNVDPGDYYIVVSKSGYGFPSQIIEEKVDGDHGDIFTAANDPLTIDIPIDPDGWLYVEKSVNKKRVSVGEIVTYNIKIQNKHWYKAVENVELVDEIVNGFKYVTGSTYRSSAKQNDPTVSSHKAVFNIGTVSANSTINLSYQVRVGTGIPNGRYKASVHTRKSTTGARNSNIASASIDVVEDPIFTRGTIIGKVFNDLDKDGWQDKGEKGIPNVKIATEYGVVVETDEDGKYHIADVPSGNHLLKVDPSTLPEGAEFTTDNPYFVKITEGLLAKVNFGATQWQATALQSSTGVPRLVGANKFFIVALGEGIVRNLDTSGNIEMVDKDDRFDDGVHVDGRLALYLKGKVLGKYLITASIDTERRPYGRYDTRELFKNLDPDKYYPVYGDASKVDYSGVNTQDIVYVMIEWDESFAKWGSFHTELPLYNRTLSGGIINYKSVGKTKFGDSWTEIKGFGAVSRQKAAHDEFVGTGGSLYYLRHDNVIEGSEKLRVEVRDRIGKTTISGIPLLEEKDYEIDYDTGRILLKRPLNSIQQAYTGSIVSNDILMGERVYLIVDYEYYSDGLSDQAWGARASQWIGHHIRVGGTYVEEQKSGDNYSIYGGDGTVKINKDTEINARYSHSEETQLGSTLSYDGGLTYQEQYDTFSNGLDGDAYSVDGRTKLFKNTDIFASYSKQDPYYSATDSISQQGSEKYIANVTSRLTENLSAGISHITQKYKEETTVTQTFAERNVYTTTGILDYQKGKWDLRGEYQHQEVKNPVTTYTYFGTIPLLENDFIATRIGYQLFSWFHPYIRGQVTVNGEANDQGTLGADITIWEKTNLNVAETVGTLGNSTLVGLTSRITEDTDVYANLEVGNHMRLGKFTKTTYGQSSLLGPDSKAYVEQDYSSYRENVVRGNILGYDKKITDTLAIGLTYERSNVENNTTVIDRDSGSIKLAYLNPDWLKASSKIEVRNDSGTPPSGGEVRQWVTENDILWRVTEGISLTGRGNWGWTTDLDNDTDEAEFYELGTGFSLRPVSWDRLNILGKYSYLMNLPPDSQWDFIEDIESRRHVYALEGAFDICRYLQLVGKFAYRDLEEKVGPRDWTQSDTYLYIGRTNFHIMNSEENKPFLLRGWDLGVEYRVLTNDQIEDTKEGFLVELDKDIGNYLRMGVGYNFTDYDDDLRNDDDWDAKGWFVRVNGKY